VIEQLRNSGSVKRGWLGVKIQNVDEDTAASLGLADAKGALVNEVTANGPAAAAGLRVQDAILAVNGERISDSRDLARKIAEFNPKATVQVQVLRDGKEVTIPVKLGTFPSSRDELAKLEESTAPAPSGASGTELGALGLTIAPAGGRNAPAEGVAISDVDESSDAARKGLKPGDVILDVNGQKVVSTTDVEGAVKRAQELGRRAVLLNVKSGEQTRIVAVQLTKKG